MFAAGLIAGGLLAGCLPKQALSRADEVEAEAYTLSLTTEVTSGGALPLAPFRWTLSATLLTSYTRSFRDGSLGTLLRFSEVSSTIARDAGAEAILPSPLEGAIFELRAFPSGEILRVSGLSAFVGRRGHSEALDLVWSALSPHLPGPKQGNVPFVTSWHQALPGGPGVRTRMEAGWLPVPIGEGAGWQYEGSLQGTGGYVRASGTTRGEITLGGRGEPRVLAHRFDVARSLETTWPTGTRATQGWHTTGELRHVGTAAAPPLDMPVGEADAEADARSLRLRDGRQVSDPAVDGAESLPYLLLPDDLTEEAAAAVRATLVGPGRLGG